MYAREFPSFPSCTSLSLIFHSKFFKLIFLFCTSMSECLQPLITQERNSQLKSCLCPVGANAQSQAHLSQHYSEIYPKTNIYGCAKFPNSSSGLQDKNTLPT